MAPKLAHRKARFRELVAVVNANADELGERLRSRGCGQEATLKQRLQNILRRGYNAHMGFFSMHGRYNAHMGLNTDKKWFREAFKQHVQYAVNAVVVSDQDRTSMSAAPDLSDGTDSVENRSNSVEHSEQAGGSGSSSNGYIDLGPSPSIWSGPRLGVFNAPWLD